jgi:hypothetical protein
MPTQAKTIFSYVWKHAKDDLFVVFFLTGLSVGNINRYATTTTTTMLSALWCAVAY